MYTIYALIDPRDNTVRYVGVTDNVYARFAQHMNCSGNNYPKNAWIHELRSMNMMLIMENLEQTEIREYAYEREQYWIQHFEMLHEPIVNISKTSSPRKSKKLNLRSGRDISHRIMFEVAPAPMPHQVNTHPEDIKKHAIQGLRDIGKRLRNGDSRADILKSYGATGGRLNQEIGAVIDMVVEEMD